MTTDILIIIMLITINSIHISYLMINKVNNKQSDCNLYGRKEEVIELIKHESI